MIHISKSWEMNRTMTAERCLDRLFTMLYRTGIMTYSDYIRDVSIETGAMHGEVKFVRRWLVKK